MKSITVTSAAVVAALIISLNAVPLFADGNNKLEVKCVDPAGDPASGVKLWLQNLGVNKKPAEKKSDGKGIALYNKLDDGGYRLWGRRDGMAPAFYEYIILKGDTQQSVTLNFESGSPDTKLYFEDAALAANAEQLMQQGIAALQAGTFPEAISKFQESLKINPTNPIAYFHMATALVQEKKWQEAEDSYKKASSIAGVMKQLPGPGGAPAEGPFAQIETLSQGNLQKLPIFKLQIEAEQLAKDRKFAEAAAKYKAALAIDPNDSYIYYAMSVALANSQQVDEAEQAINKAIELKPGDATYAEMKKKVAQVKENQLLLKAQSLLTEGDKLYNGGDFAGALAKYEEARPMIPEKNLAGVLTQLGRTYGKLNQPEKAVESFNKAIELAPDSPNPRTALAQYYLNEKKYEEALNVYADPRATGTKPPDQALFELAQKLSAAGNSDVAELAYEKVLRANPDHPDACYELGMLLYYAKKDDKRAKELLEKYVKLGQDKGKIDNASTVLVVIKKRSP